jgi:hypothetical protein
MLVSLPRNSSDGILRVYFYFLLHGKEFRVVFSSAEGSERNSENLHLFRFHGKVIPYLQCQPTEWITNNTKIFKFSRKNVVKNTVARDVRLSCIPLHCSQLTTVKFCALGNQGDWVHRVIELSCVFFRRRVRNRIMGVCFYFYSSERNSELFSLPRKGSERNSEIFCSAEQPESRRK